MSNRGLVSWVGVFLFGFSCAIAVWYFVGWIYLTDAGGRLALSSQVSKSEASDESNRMLAEAREHVREHSKNGTAPQVLAGDESMPGCGFQPKDLQGLHYELANAVITRGDGVVELIAIPLTGSYPLLRLRFRLDADDDGELEEFWVADD